MSTQILSLKDEYTFHFSNFLIIGLCNCFANCWFEIFSFLTPLPANLLRIAKVSDCACLAEEFLSRIYKLLTQDLFDTHILDI